MHGIWGFEMGHYVSATAEGHRCGLEVLPGFVAPPGRAHRSVVDGVDMMRKLEAYPMAVTTLPEFGGPLAVITLPKSVPDTPAQRQRAIRAWEAEYPLYQCIVVQEGVAVHRVGEEEVSRVGESEIEELMSALPPERVGDKPFDVITLTQNVPRALLPLSWQFAAVLALQMCCGLIVAWRMGWM